MLTPEALARVQRRMDSCGAHKKFSEHCSDCAHVRALEAALAALTPAHDRETTKMVSEGKVYGPGVSVPPLPPDTPPPPEPEVREALDLYWKVVGAQPVEGTKILEAALARARGQG